MRTRTLVAFSEKLDPEQKSVCYYYCFFSFSVKPLLRVDSLFVSK